MDLGLLRERDYPGIGVVYRYASLGRGADALGCDRIGKPASVTAIPLISLGWRAHVWSGYLATLEGGVISQETKHRLTGVDPRTQRNYQATIAVKKIQNYSNTNLVPELAAGVSDVQEKHIFNNEKTNKAVQRLPDILIVPSEIARSLPKGRSRKAQKLVNSTLFDDSLYLGAGSSSGVVMRLFHESPEGAEKAVRKAEFGEAFWLKTPGQYANQWDVISMEVQL